jgi:hypothetical protein
MPSLLLARIVDRQLRVKDCTSHENVRCDIKQRIVGRPDGHSSLPVITGLDPVIIFFEEISRRWMDTRVKPAYDGVLLSTIGRICSIYRQ